MMTIEPMNWIESAQEFNWWAGCSWQSKHHQGKEVKYYMVSYDAVEKWRVQETSINKVKIYFTKKMWCVSTLYKGLLQ